MQETTEAAFRYNPFCLFFIAGGVAQRRVRVESGLNPCVVGARNVGSLARVELGRGWTSPQRKIGHTPSGRFPLSFVILQLSTVSIFLVIIITICSWFSDFLVYLFVLQRRAGAIFPYSSSAQPSAWHIVKTQNIFVKHIPHSVKLNIKLESPHGSVFPRFSPS